MNIGLAVKLNKNKEKMNFAELSNKNSLMSKEFPLLILHKKPFSYKKMNLPLSFLLMNLPSLKEYPFYLIWLSLSNRLKIILIMIKLLRRL
jgi:hypothetical protein